MPIFHPYTYGKGIQNGNIGFVHPIFGFWFLVTFGNENTKILHNLCLHFSSKDGHDGKEGKKITQLT